MLFVAFVLGLATLALLIGSRALLVSLLVIVTGLHWRARRELNVALRSRILAALAHGESYALHVSEGSGFELVEVYMMLREMEAEGVLTSRETKETYPERGGRPRRMFALAATPEQEKVGG